MKSESLRPEENPATAFSTDAIPVSPSHSEPASAVIPEKLSLHIPPILLEGDDSKPADITEDAQKFSLGSEASAAPLENEGELPEAYGTKKLLLTARDPHWLYAHWDLTREQQRQYCDQSADGHLTLRIHRDNLVEPVAEVSLQANARHWFVHVVESGTHYNAELGCHTSDGEWISISTSAPTFAPPGKISQNTSAEFATIPFETPLPDLVALTAGPAMQPISLAEALEKLRNLGHPDLLASPSVRTWTMEQERALAEMFAPQSLRTVPPSSFTLTDTFPQWLDESPSSPGGISSPFGGEALSQNFWFNINAELVIYGATEPNATVTIGSQPVQLRADGSFSFRFVLPDGNYELPVVAVSANQTDGRAAVLKFTRFTERRGDVGNYPQDSKLKPPAPKNL